MKSPFLGNPCLDLQVEDSISRSAFLIAIVIAVLVIAIPFAVAEFIKTGEPYLLSQRFLADMVERLHGPGQLRFILQPTVAIVLGARDGIKDARAGNPPVSMGVSVPFHPSARTHA